MTAAAGVPAWYEPVVPTVRAAVFADPRTSRGLLGWLSNLSRAAELHSEPADGGVLVRERVDGSVRETLLRVGDVAVEVPGSRFGWDAVGGASFRLRYTVRPRELPVFDSGDGDVE